MNEKGIGKRMKKFSHYCEEQLNEEYGFNLQHGELSQVCATTKDAANYIDLFLVDSELNGKTLMEEFLESYHSWCAENDCGSQLDLEVKQV